MSDLEVPEGVVEEAQRSMWASRPTWNRAASFDAEDDDVRRELEDAARLSAPVVAKWAYRKALAGALAAADGSPAVTWTGKGGARGCIQSLLDGARGEDEQ